jgi:MazG family protein
VFKEVAVSALEQPAEFATLVDIVARLRGPGGCPWDRQQSHASLRECLLEETYEVLEALDAGDSQRLAVELGDLLLQVVMHSQIAKDAGEFELGDVIGGISTKLVRRHPHVFASAVADSAEKVMVNWEAIKKKERRQDAGMLDGVPKQMPALAYSQEIQGRVARVGFDWDDDQGVIDKLAEEVGEFQQAENKEQQAAEFGDLLFTLANIARRRGIDLEAALRQANNKFYRRFGRMEELCRQRGLEFEKLSFDQQNQLWEEVKAQLKED